MSEADGIAAIIRVARLLPVIAMIVGTFISGYWLGRYRGYGRGYLDGLEQYAKAAERT